MKKTKLLCTTLLVSVIAFGQHSPNKGNALKRGSLAGRVFAITEGGDLKPARIADVAVLYISGSTRDGKAIDEGETAGLTYLEEDNKASELYLNNLTREGSNWSEKLRCFKDLHAFEAVIVKTREWAEVHKKLSQIITTQTDEDGYFSVSLPVGKYIVLVRGRAGFNDALWVDDDITIPSTERIEIKLSSPKKSCLNMGN